MSSKDQSCLCVIGARKGSKRLPGKNRKEILGRPLYRLAVDAALKAGIFSEFIFSTDDNLILQDLSGFPGVVVAQREHLLAGDKVVMWDVGLHLLEKYHSLADAAGTLCFISPCHPFRGPEIIRNAHNLFHSSKADSLISITEFPAPPELAVSLLDGQVKRSWQGPVRKGEYQESYYLNGAITFVKKTFFLKNRDVYSDQTVGYEIDWPYSLDIDYPADLELARKLATTFLDY